MSGRLVAEVLDNAAAHGLTHGEVRLLVSLAERANDETRECWPGMDELRKRMGAQNERAVGRVLASLADKGLEARVPLCRAGSRDVMRDRAGRVVYAVSGHRTTYRLPRMQRE